jgi:hypothetical protein
MAALEERRTFIPAPRQAYVPSAAALKGSSTAARQKRYRAACTPRPRIPVADLSEKQPSSIETTFDSYSALIVSCRFESSILPLRECNQLFRRYTQCLRVFTLKVENANNSFRNELERIFVRMQKTGERGWTRTIDPCLKRALLYQLSYAPVFCNRAVAEDAKACAAL